MDKILRTAIAGFGRSGCDIHGKYLETDPRFKVVAVADALPERRKDAVDMFGCKVYEDYTQMIEDGGFDLLIDATPTPMHEWCARMALRKGINVIQEKPSASYGIYFDMLCNYADQNHCLFLPFQNSRFQPCFQKMQEVIASGVLGKIIFIRMNWSGFHRRWDWQTRQSNEAGDLRNTGPHPLDQAIVLYGDEMPNVFCRQDSYHYGLGGDADNFDLLTLWGPGHPTIEIQLSAFQAYPNGDLYSIEGTYGGLTGNLSELKWKYFDPEKAPKQEFWKPWSRNREYCSEKLEWTEINWKNDEAEQNRVGFRGITAASYNHYYDVIVNDAKRIITLEQVRRQIAVYDEVRRQNSLPRIDANRGGSSPWNA